MKKQIILTALGAMLLASCADTFENTYTGTDPDDPAKVYLKEYQPLKEYVDRTPNPNFKLGVALDAADFNAQERVYTLAKSNYDEVVAGNAMKMASCVDDKGNMDFGTVTTFVNTAEEAGLNVYGHTLAWHAQQPVKYLNGLIADKQIEIDPEKKIETEVASVSYNDGPFPFFPMGSEPPVINGAIHFVPTGEWSQFFITNAIDLTAGDYVVKLQIASTQEGSIKLTAQNGWGDDAQQMDGIVKLEKGWAEVTVKFNGLVGGKYDLILKPETFGGTIDLKGFTVYKLESPAIEIETLFKDFTYLEAYGSEHAFPFYPMGCEPPIVNGAIHYVPTGAWSQFFIDNATELSKGDYKLVLHIKADQEASIKLTAQNGWGSDAQSMECTVKLTAEWADVVLKLNGIEGGNYDFILKPETTPATIDLLGYTIYKVEKGNTIPLTPEEKKEILTGAMNTWVAGMMDATSAKVKAFDLINEAVSGDGNVQGFYDLQHLPVGNTTDFFWQDYLGSEDYGPIVEAAAREGFAAAGGNPADLKLFINDYNLESDWDQNKKLKSLIYWIGVWESRGAKIDGIGSQMHISYYENPQTLANKKAAIVNMYKLAAETGKLVRVSEFDMGYVDANGNDVSTDNLTEAQHKAMAEYWNWNIRAYLDNVPAAQQYGFCNWCITDAPANSGWRGGQPVGLWDQNYYRKHAYAGYADGLQKKDYQNK